MAQLMSLALILVAGVSGYYLGGLGMVPQAKLAAAEAARDEAQKKIAAAQTAITEPGQNLGYWTSGPSMYGTGSIGPRPDFSMGPQSAAGQFASIGGQSWR